MPQVVCFKVVVQKDGGSEWLLALEMWRSLVTLAVGFVKNVAVKVTASKSPRGEKAETGHLDGS